MPVMTPPVAVSASATADASHPLRPLLRRTTQVGFFLLFMLAPLLNLLRIDFVGGHLILLGQPLSIGLDAVRAGQITGGEAALRVLGLLFVPALLTAAGFLYVAWRWGRVYCGWLCPHFSMVEMLNRWMELGWGAPTVWDWLKLRPCLPPQLSRWVSRAVFVLLMLIGAHLWAAALLSYGWSPPEVWHAVLTGASQGLPAAAQRFLWIATAVFALDFLFARHLFCRYACAVGLAQSLAWMTHREAMVVDFDRSRAEACKGCGSRCDAACPMQLKPRSAKRLMFACTQCSSCLQACEGRSAERRATLGPQAVVQPIRWVSGPAAARGDAAQGLIATQASGERDGRLVR